MQTGLVAGWRLCKGALPDTSIRRFATDPVRVSCQDVTPCHCGLKVHRVYRPRYQRKNRARLRAAEKPVYTGFYFGMRKTHGRIYYMTRLD
jgi:hypothetical protein